MLDGRIKFRHLQCFLAVARHGGIQKAASALAITSPAVSKTIKELEGLLKAQLFERGRRGTRMTVQAEVFAAYAGAAVSALQLAADCMEPDKTAVSPEIRIGATPAMSVTFVPDALMAFNAHVPDIQVSVLTGTTSFLMDQLRDAHFDLVLCRHLDPEKMVGLSFEYLYADPLVVVVRPDHPLLTKLVPVSDSMLRFIAILPPKTSVNRRAAMPLAIALNIRPGKNYIETHSVSFGRTYTMNSDAIWFVPWCAVKPDIENGRLVRLTPPGEDGDEMPSLTSRSTGLMMRSNFVPSPQLQILIAAMRQCAEKKRGEVL
jgi:LysR family pca operon transcriptional activator